MSEHDVRERSQHTVRAITTTQALLTGAWKEDVRVMQAALGRITTVGTSVNCHVTFFEVAGDGNLHVSVAHRSTGNGANGSSGSPIIPDGAVYARSFVREPRYQVLRQIRHMVFAGPS